MKFEIEEISTTTILKQVEAENASEAEEKASNDSTAIMKKSEIKKEIRITAPVSKAPPPRRHLNLPPPRKNLS